MSHLPAYGAPVPPSVYVSVNRSSPSSYTTIHLPDEIEIYQSKSPHYSLSSPATDITTSSRASPLSHIDTKLMTIKHGFSIVPESVVSMHLNASEESDIVGKVRVTTSHTHIMTLYTRPEEGIEKGRGAPVFVTMHWPKGKAKEEKWWFEFDRYGGGGEKEKFEWVDAMDEEAGNLARQNIASENYSQSNHPLKLISSTSSASTQDPIAYFCPGQKDETLNPRQISGKLTFPSPSSLPRVSDDKEHQVGNTRRGDELFRVLVTLSVLDLIERWRQSGKKRAGLTLEGIGQAAVTALSSGFQGLN